MYDLLMSFNYRRVEHSCYFIFSFVMLFLSRLDTFSWCYEGVDEKDKAHHDHMDDLFM